MRPLSYWFLLLTIAATILIPPGELPCWLLDRPAPAFSQLPVANQTSIGTGCPFAAIEAAFSPAMPLSVTAVDRVIAWLARGILLHPAQRLVLSEKDWLSRPNDPPPKTPCALSA